MFKLVILLLLSGPGLDHPTPMQLISSFSTQTIEQCEAIRVAGPENEQSVAAAQVSVEAQGLKVEKIESKCVPNDKDPAA